MISVIVPTISARESWFRRCVDAYFATTELDFEVIPVKDKPTCGIAWNEGARKAKGDYLHFSADDLEPHAGWAPAAVACVVAGAIPSARVLNTDGTLQSCGAWGVELAEGEVTDIARVPFCSRSQWDRLGPIIETHYYTDNHFSFRALSAGIPTVICRDYLFTHHFAPEGRLDGNGGRMDADRSVFERALAHA